MARTTTKRSWMVAAGLAALTIVTTVTTTGPAGATEETRATEATPRLVADYRFQANRNSTVPGAPALFNVGPGTNTFAVENVDGNQRTVLQFPAANGVELRSATNVIPRDRYTMAIKLRFDDTSGYRRIVNFVLGTANADRGLYNLAGDLTLSPVSFGSGSPINPDEWVLVVLTRSANGRIRGYVDGIAEFDITATAEAKIGPANTLRFFRDDANRQESSGAVARIRLYDRTMTPAQVAALGS